MRPHVIAGDARTLIQEDRPAVQWRAQKGYRVSRVSFLGHLIHKPGVSRAARARAPLANGSDMRLRNLFISDRGNDFFHFFRPSLRIGAVLICIRVGCDNKNVTYLRGGCDAILIRKHW